MPLFPESGARPERRPPGTGTGWFGLPSTTSPSRFGSRHRDDEPFLKRHFWPPSLFGGMALALVVAVMVGFLGALAYTSSEQRQITARTSEGEPQTTVAPAASSDPEQVTTTTMAELSPEALRSKAAPSVWSINTLDDAGRPVEGSAFVTGSSGGQTFLLTSLALVRSATRLPGPVISARNGGTQLDAVLWTWHEERDLALLAIARTVPSLLWAGDVAAIRAGQKVFGAAGGAGVTAGAVTNTSPAAIGHNVFTEGARRGGPLLNTRGEVLGVLSADYDPGGAATDRLFFAVPVGAACERVLVCGATTTTTRPKSGSTTTTRTPAPTTSAP